VSRRTAAELLNQLCPPFEKESVLKCGNCDNPLTEEEANRIYARTAISNMAIMWSSN